MHTCLRKLATLALFGLLACGAVIGANAAPSPPPAPDYGAPPSGQVPILFNDHTVYATPDLLKQGRVLAAIIKDGQIYVPLRSMLEQMGATVTASADGHTISAVRDTTSVSVTLDKPEVVINGETRPLDVPPLMYQGVMLVPVRVLSEALGAYVQWVPDRRLVVVRYIPPTPMPAATPVAATPAPSPSPTPTPVPTEQPYHFFVQAAVADRKNYNEFTAGGDCPQSYFVDGALVFNNSPLALKVDFRQDAYVTSDNYDFYGNHYTQFGTIDGGAALTPVFLGKQSSLDGRLEFRIADPKIYVGLGYLQTANNFGYPSLTGFGAGIEKLPDLHKGLNLYGSAFYYPSAVGTYTVPSAGSSNAGKSYRQRFAIVKYDIGLALVLGRSPVYLFGGFNADRYYAKQNAPIGQSHAGPYVGLGLKL